MLATFAMMLAPLGLVVALVLALNQEDVALRRRVRRSRELALEGLDELPAGDPYPEEGVTAGFLREPNGRAADSNRVLREELELAREHTRAQAGHRSRRKSTSRRRGIECLP